MTSPRQASLLILDGEKVFMPQEQNCEKLLKLAEEAGSQSVYFLHVTLTESISYTFQGMYESPSILLAYNGHAFPFPIFGIGFVLSNTEAVLILKFISKDVTEEDISSEVRYIFDGPFGHTDSSKELIYRYAPATREGLVSLGFDCL